MATYDVGFRVNGKGLTEARVEASDSRDAEQKVEKKYNQPIEIVYVRKK